MFQVLVLLWGVLLTPEALAKRVALVIGNGAYQHTTQLEQAPKDAKLVADTLEALGFETIRVRDEALRPTLEALERFKKAAGGAELAFIYYAGHAIEVGGVNFLLPVDAQLGSPAQARIQAVMADQLIADLAEAGVGLGVVILDACRNNPFVRAWAGSSRAFGKRGLEEVQLPIGVDFLVAFPVQPGEVTADDGLYARALVKYLQAPCVGVPEVFSGVTGDLRGVQEPWVRALHGRAAHRQFLAGCSGEPRQVDAWYQKGLESFGAKRYAEAMRWARKAAEEGHGPAADLVGFMYQNGSGVEMDFALAKEWYEKALKAGSASALHDLGYLYLNGLGVERDLVEAIRWFKEADEAGHAPGTAQLGYMYANGHGVEPNPKEALRLYTKAADLGSVEAMWNAAVMYANGKGVPISRGKAVEWYRRAARAGDERAKSELRKWGLDW